jgi:hypothetical protein
MGGIVPLGNLGISIIGPPEIGKVRSPRCRNAGASLASPRGLVAGAVGYRVAACIGVHIFGNLIPAIA